MPSRRHLITAAIGASAALCVPRLSTRGVRAASVSGYSNLIAYCTDLRCPEPVGLECLLTLPSTVTLGRLAREILASLPAGEGVSVSAIGLSHLIRKASRTDFENVRVLYVNGWMLSLTETRVYALAALITR